MSLLECQLKMMPFHNPVALFKGPKGNIYHLDHWGSHTSFSESLQVGFMYNCVSWSSFVPDARDAQITLEKLKPGVESSQAVRPRELSHFLRSFSWKFAVRSSWGQHQSQASPDSLTPPRGMWLPFCRTSWIAWILCLCNSLLGLRNQVPQTGGLKEQKYIVSQVWRLKVWDQRFDRVGCFWGLSPWFVDDPLCPVSSRALPSVCVS